VLIDVLCRYIRGEPFPKSDARNAGFLEMRELSELDIVPSALEVIEQAAKVRPSAAHDATDPGA
jgi:hypothetical protein